MLNMVLQVISMVMCAVGLLQVIIGSRRWKQSIFFYVVFYIALFMYAEIVFAELRIEGQTGEAVYTALTVCNCFRFFLVHFIAYTCTRWLLYSTDGLKQRKALQWEALGLFIAQLLAFFVLYFTGNCYFIDSDNVLHVKTGYYIQLALWLIWVVNAIYLLIRYQKNVQSRSRFVLWMLAFVSTAGVILQFVFIDVNFVTVAVSSSAVLLFVLIINDMAQDQIRSERVIEKLKTDMMLSQIQPHFLYNALTSIKHLCRVDPQGAEKAVTEFAVYIRGNMDSLTADTPIRFSEELSHTHAYLSLEKLRFGDDLTIVEQIECTSFLIPALTLQPIVENAVRHGVRETEDGRGTVTIATKEYPDRYEVTVSDDGRGFDTDRLDENDHRHLGVQNVRYRLEHMSGGSLAICSVSGQGTEAVITLPKQE